MHQTKYIVCTFFLTAFFSMHSMTVEELQPKDEQTISNYLNPSYRNYVPDIPWKSLVTYKDSADGVIPGDAWEVGNPVDYHDYNTYGKGAFICNRGGIYTATQTDKFGVWDFDHPDGYPLEEQWKVTVIKQPITQKKVYAKLKKDKVLMGNTGRHVAPADGNSPFGRAIREYMKPHTFTLVRCGCENILGVAKRDNTIDIYNRNQKILTCNFDDITIADILFSPNIKDIFFVLGERYHRRSSLDFRREVSEKQLIKVTMDNGDYDTNDINIPKRLTYDPLTINQDHDISLIGYETSPNPQNDNEFAFTFTQDLEKKRCKTHQNEAPERSCLQGCFSLQAIYYTNKDPISLLYLRHFPRLHALALKSNRSDNVIDLRQIPNESYGMHITRDLNEIISAPETYSPDRPYYDPLLKKYFSENSLIKLKANLPGYGYLNKYRTNIWDDNPNDWTNLVDHWEKLLKIYAKDNDLKKSVILGNIAEYSIISGNAVKHIVTSTPLGELWYQTHNKEQILISPIVEEVVEEAMEQEDKDIQPETSATVTQHNNLVLIQQKLDRFKKNVWTIAALPDKMKNLTAKQLCMTSGSLSSFVSHPNKPVGFIHYREKNNNKEESRIKYVNLENKCICDLDAKRYTRGIFTKNNKIAAYLRPQSRRGYIPYLLWPKMHILDRSTYKEDTGFAFLPGTEEQSFKTWIDFVGRCKDVWHMMCKTW
ncbi:MAG TPA: hypothetical protein VGW78_06285 [Candidatus Babeliales bacterium]|jgi:hypothetical protein|nr:hypothetical protein [Candidatus Babeliales bacterium]